MTVARLSSGPRLVATVCDAWGLVDPLRYAVELLLDFGRVANPLMVLDGCLMLVGAAREYDRSNRTRGSSDLYATQVAEAFGLGVHLKAVLLELRWAGLSGSAEERNSHLDRAEDRLVEAITSIQQRNGPRAVATALEHPMHPPGERPELAATGRVVQLVRAPGERP